MGRQAGRFAARAIAAATIVAIATLGLPTPASASPPAGKVYVNDTSVAEGNSGTTNAVFTISLSPARGTVSVDWATSSGTATSGTDFTASSGRVSVSKTTPTVQVAVPVIGDPINESNETFNVNLSNASGGTIGDALGVGTITNDDAQPTISINDVAVTEGTSGTTVAVFTVTLSAPSGQTVTVGYAIADGTAVAPGDYATASGTVSFVPGEAAKPVNVSVKGDTIDEGDEIYRLDLSGATNASIADAQGIGTITDDDSSQLSVSDVTIPEGDVGTTSAVFAIALSVPSAQIVTVQWATADATAGSASDYTASSGNLSFAAGQTLKSVSVPVVGDTTDEPDETFEVNLSNPVNAALTDGTGVATISDDDAAPSLSVNDMSVNEGDMGTTTMSFTATLSAASGRTVTVHAATADGVAVAPRDYAAISTDLTFAPGQSTKQVDVVIGTDTWYELDETFTLVLSTPMNASLADDTGVGTIVNDDAVVGIDINDVTVLEGDAGTTVATFDVILSGPSGLSTTVDWATADGTAAEGQDFTAGSGTLTFAPGVTGQQVSVDVLGDTTDEPDETFSVSLSGPFNAGLETFQGTGTVTNDDPANTALTMSVKKTRKSVTAKGLLDPAAPGMRVTVTLLKKKGARYVKVRARSVPVRSLIDRDGDSLTEGAYAARFKRPAAGSYKLTASFAGNVNFLPSSATKRVKL
jgi:Calx-beta domain-containing protein